MGKKKSLVGYTPKYWMKDFKYCNPPLGNRYICTPTIYASKYYGKKVRITIEELPNQHK